MKFQIIIAAALTLVGISNGHTASDRELLAYPCRKEPEHSCPGCPAPTGPCPNSRILTQNLRGIK